MVASLTSAVVLGSNFTGGTVYRSARKISRAVLVSALRSSVLAVRARSACLKVATVTEFGTIYALIFIQVTVDTKLKWPGPLNPSPPT
jgi:hypothetical protein